MYFLSRCGRRIIANEATQLHLRAHPEVWPLLAEACLRVQLPIDGSTFNDEVEMGKIVGRSGCVTTPRVGLEMKTTFAQRPARLGLSRVIIGVGREVSHVVIVASPVDPNRPDHDYALHTAYIGERAPKEPWNLSITTKEEWLTSFSFWATHALIYDSKVMGPIVMTTWGAVCKAVAAKMSEAK